MPSSEAAITQLLYRYAECIDNGDLDGAFALFAHAEIQSGASSEPVAPSMMLAAWKDLVIMYDGVPRTKHVMTNPVVEVDEDTGRATSRSHYTVFQQVGGHPIEVLITGRYHDEFERVDGTWRFTRRDYTNVDLIGDLSRHNRPGSPPRTK